MTKDDLILQTLHNSNLTEELRDAEIEALARIIVVREYKAGEAILKPGEVELKDLLLSDHQIHQHLSFLHSA